MLSSIFPSHLTRLAFLVRLLLVQALVSFCIADLTGSWARGLDGNNLTTLAVCAGLILYGVFFVYLPRVRDCALPGWTVLIAAVPGISALFGLVLLFAPSRGLVIGGGQSGEAHIAPGEDGKGPAANKCMSCGCVVSEDPGKSINPYGGVLCAACAAPGEGRR